MKRVVSVILAACLLTAALPLTASAAGIAAGTRSLRSGSDIFRYNPEAAAWLESGLRGWGNDILGKIAPYGATLLYWLLWPGAKQAYPDAGIAEQRRCLL